MRRSPAWYARERRTTIFPTASSSPGELRERLRYGENPHQSAALYLTGEPAPSIATARQVQGKELSYNNINDADAAFELVSDLAAEQPAVAIVKHANPCGAALGADLVEAYDKALALRSGLRLWRHRRGEPAARRSGGRGDHRHLHRGRRRARRRRGGARGLRQESRTCACS